MTAQPDCKSRIGEHLASRMEDISTLWTCYQHGITDCDDWRRLDTAERVELCQKLDVSVFSARNDNGPLWDLGTLDEYGLSFDYVAPDTFTGQAKGYFRWQLSYGGPSDEFRFHINPDFSCRAIEYWFLDWFDGAHLRIDRGGIIGEWFEMMRELGTAKNEF